MFVATFPRSQNDTEQSPMTRVHLLRPKDYDQMQWASLRSARWKDLQHLLASEYLMGFGEVDMNWPKRLHHPSNSLRKKYISSTNKTQSCGWRHDILHFPMQIATQSKQFDIQCQYISAEYAYPLSNHNFSKILFNSIINFSSNQLSNQLKTTFLPTCSPPAYPQWPPRHCPCKALGGQDHKDKRPPTRHGFRHGTWRSWSSWSSWNMSDVILICFFSLGRF